jgi:pSer/pThr/pTyr-binding forkhead associated (FHA) protein
MSTKVILTIEEGSQQKEQLVFQEQSSCVVGRSTDCQIRVPNDWVHQDVSRRHCLLRIEPPSVHVQDLGSRNGTFVNDQLIGRRSMDTEPRETESVQSQAWPLHDGDTVQVGGMKLRVRIAGSSSRKPKCEFADFEIPPMREGA